MDDPITLPPLLVRRHEEIDVKTAMFRTGYSEKTIRRLFKRHRLGAKTVRHAPLRISEPGLMMVKHGDLEALELLRAGQRDHPAVRRYFVELGFVYVRGIRNSMEPAPLPEWKRRRDLTLAELEHTVELETSV